MEKWGLCHRRPTYQVATSNLLLKPGRDTWMNLQNLINSRAGVALALTISRVVPPRLGYFLADWAAGQVAKRRDLPLVQAVRANQWVISDGRLSGAALDRQVRAVLRQTGHSLYDYYHYLNNPDWVERTVQFAPSFECYLDRAGKDSQGTLFVAPHLSNFDLSLRALAQRGLNCMVLSYPDPPKGYRWQNDLRRKLGIDLVPLSASSLRLAGQRLKAGGTVLTGIDRPNSDEKYQPRFFGRPAALPVTPVRLALRTGARVVVLGNLKMPDGRLCIEAADPIQMVPHPDLTTELISNAEPVLAAAERFIRCAPEQWAMFYPVWPEVLPEAV